MAKGHQASASPSVPGGPAALVPASGRLSEDQAAPPPQPGWHRWQGPRGPSEGTSLLLPPGSAVQRAAALDAAILQGPSFPTQQATSTQGSRVPVSWPRPNRVTRAAGQHVVAHGSFSRWCPVSGRLSERLVTSTQAENSRGNPETCPGTFRHTVRGPLRVGFTPPKHREQVCQPGGHGKHVLF